AAPEYGYTPEAGLRRGKWPRPVLNRSAFYIVTMSWLHRHNDLAEMAVGFHVRIGLRDVGEGEHLVDRQRESTCGDRRPEIGTHRGEDVADFRDGAAAERDADIVDAPRRVQVEVERA